MLALLVAAPAAAGSFSAPRGVSLPSAPLSAPAAAALPAGPALPGAGAIPGSAAPTFLPLAEISGGPTAATALPTTPALAAAAAPRPQAAEAGGAHASAGGQAGKVAAAPGAASAAFDGAALPAPDKDDLEKVDPLEMGPMQIPVGMREVQQKEKKLRGMDDKEQKKWLQEKAVPYVLRNGKRRMIDHHHETRAAWQAGLDRVYAYSAVTKQDQAQLDKLSDEDFWAEMNRRGWFYDKDQFGGGPHDPKHLPEDTRGHGDDPFRSVAGEVRNRGGYDKNSAPFSEFVWANFFRERVKTYPKGDADFEKAVKEAMVLAKSVDAKHLPGYNGK